MKEQIRTMNEQGDIPIPISIQEEMGFKASSLPRFMIKIEERPLRHIALYPIETTVDESGFLES